MTRYTKHQNALTGDIVSARYVTPQQDIDACRAAHKLGLFASVSPVVVVYTDADDFYYQVPEKFVAQFHGLESESVERSLNLSSLIPMGEIRPLITDRGKFRTMGKVVPGGVIEYAFFEGSIATTFIPGAVLRGTDSKAEYAIE